MKHIIEVPTLALTKSASFALCLGSKVEEEGKKMKERRKKGQRWRSISPPNLATLFGSLPLPSFLPSTPYPNMGTCSTPFPFPSVPFSPFPLIQSPKCSMLMIFFFYILFFTQLKLYVAVNQNLEPQPRPQISILLLILWFWTILALLFYHYCIRVIIRWCAFWFWTLLLVRVVSSRDPIWNVVSRLKPDLPISLVYYSSWHQCSS